MNSILVIEDEQDIRENIIETLQLGGYNVQGAHNGERGLSLAKHLQPDLILCDIMMDEIDGYGVLDALRDNRILASTPLIFITALADRRSQRRGMVNGADDFIVKPFSTSELLDAVDARLNRQKDLKHGAELHLDDARHQLHDLIAEEIQKPVESLALMTEAIMTQINQLSHTEIEDLMDAVHYGSHRLRRVTQQIGLLAQLDTGLLSSHSINEQGHPVHIRDVSMAALAVARKIAEGADVDVYFEGDDTDIEVWADTDSLRQALAELIANAFQHSPDGGKITVSQIITEGVVRFSVTDSGDGFAVLTLPDDTITGVGMGLDIAQRVIRAHNGELRIDSNPYIGTVAQVSLPIYRD